MSEYNQEALQNYAELRGITMEEAKKDIDAFKQRIDERENKINRTGSAEYLEWLYNFIEPNKIYDDETALYEMNDGTDRDNLLDISYLQTYIERKAEEQDVENILDKDNEFQILNFVFSYKDKLYQIDTMVGQGAITFICLTDNKEKRKVVEL